MSKSGDSHHVSKGIWYAVVASYISSILVLVAVVVYVNYVDNRSSQRFNDVDRQSNQRWCTVVSTMDDAYRETPPTTEIGKKIAAGIHQIDIDFGC